MVSCERLRKIPFEQSGGVAGRACIVHQGEIGDGMEIWAHRGCHGYDKLLENTLPAFQRAVDDDVDGIELDVHISADGVPIVFHDDCLRRLSVGGRRAPVAGLALSELKIGRSEGGGTRFPRWTRLWVLSVIRWPSILS